MNKLLTMGILFIGLTTSTFAKYSTADFHQSCRNGAIATFKMTKGVVYAFFDGGHKKPFKCSTGLCTKTHFTNRHGLSYHRVIGSVQHIKRHTVRCK